jgi:hypothetical protein
MQCSNETLQQSYYKPCYAGLCSLLRGYKVRRNFSETSNQIALMETQRLLDWRSGARDKAQHMFATVFALATESFRFLKSPRLPIPRLRFTAAPLASREASHWHFPECSPVPEYRCHRRLSPLGKQYGFNDMSNFRYVV